jgi:hypothetical protein
VKLYCSDDFLGSFDGMGILSVPGQMGAVLRGNQNVDATGANVFTFFQLQRLWNNIFRTFETQHNRASRSQPQCEVWLMSKAQSWVYHYYAT